MKEELNLLKNQIRKSNLELEKKNVEINGYIEKIQLIEDELLEYHEIISKAPSQEKKQKIMDTKFSFELKEKEREIRDLKNSMGFLRKEKIFAQRELEEFKRISETSAMSIEEIREKEKLISNVLNFETLTNELRKKLYQQEIIMRNFKTEMGEKKEQIERLNLMVKEIDQEQSIKNSILEGRVDKNIKKELNKRLQKELDKSKKQIDDLKNKLTKYRKPETEKIKNNIEINELRNKISFLEKELERKDRIINKLKSKNTNHLD